MEALDFPLLRLSLEAAVPLKVEEMRNWDPDTRAKVARSIADAIAEKGDILMYRSKVKGETAQVFNQTVTALAALAIASGGVHFAGMHFSADPHERGRLGLPCLKCERGE